MSFRGSLCLTFSYHIHGSDTDYLTVFTKHEEDTSIVFHEGLYDYNKWQKAHVMLATNGTFQVGAVIGLIVNEQFICAPERTVKPSQAPTLFHV